MSAAAAINSTAPISLSKSTQPLHITLCHYYLLLPFPPPHPTTMLSFSKPFILLALAILSTAGAVAGDSASDRSDCAKDLVQHLSTCLEYVQGRGHAPTPDCCAGLDEVRTEKPKCLCVLIKDHDSPELGVKINVTLAIGLPTVCHVQANVSHCPKLLNIAPDSKDAEIFKQPAGMAATQGNGSSSSSDVTGIQAHGAAPGGGGSVANSGAGSGLLGKHEAGMWVGVENVCGIWICAFMSLLSIFMAP